MSTQVTMEDGTQQELQTHLHDEHQKGTRGFTDEYLRTLHTVLHQRQREAGPEHKHPGAGGEATPDVG